MVQKGIICFKVYKKDNWLDWLTKNRIKFSYLIEKAIEAHDQVGVGAK